MFFNLRSVPFNLLLCLLLQTSLQLSQLLCLLETYVNDQYKSYNMLHFFPLTRSCSLLSVVNLGCYSEPEALVKEVLAPFNNMMSCNVMYHKLTRKRKETLKEKFLWPVFWSIPPHELLPFHQTCRQHLWKKHSEQFIEILCKRRVTFHNSRPEMILKRILWVVRALGETSPSNFTPQIKSQRG